MFFKMRSAYFVATLASVLTVAAVASAKYSVTAPKILMKAKGPVGVKIDGESNDLTFIEGETNFIFKTKLSKMDTKNPGRNEHMKTRFEASTFDEITLSVPKDKVDISNTPKDKEGNDVPRWVKGTLKFHGIEREKLVIGYTVKDKRVNAFFTFDVLKHNIPEKNLCFEPRTKSICAQKDVELKVEFTVKE